MKKAADEHRLIQLTDIGVDDPERAAELAKSISDPELKAIALASVAPAYTRVDKKTADSWLKYANVQLDTMKDEGNRLRLLVTLAKANFANHHEQDALNFTTKALDLGEELFSGDLRANPGKMAYETTGNDEITGIVELAAEKSSQPVKVIARIREIHNDVLEADALVAAAEGISKNKTTAVQMSTAESDNKKRDKMKIARNRFNAQVVLIFGQFHLR